MKENFIDHRGTDSFREVDFNLFHRATGGSLRTINLIETIDARRMIDCFAATITAVMNNRMGANLFVISDFISPYE